MLFSLADARPSRRHAASQQCGRFRGEADIWRATLTAPDLWLRGLNGAWKDKVSTREKIFKKNKKGELSDAVPAPRPRGKAIPKNIIRPPDFCGFDMNQWNGRSE